MSVSKTAVDSVAQRPNPRTESGQRFWRDYFAVYDTLNESIPYRTLVEQHGKLLRAEPGDRILDAGTGTGNVALDLVKRGASVVGVDYCREALELCRLKVPEAEFAFADLTAELSFPARSFDKAACCNVIYTLPPEGQPTAVRELERVLRPGGLLAVTVFRQGFKALRVYAETLRARGREQGLAQTLVYALRYSINTVRILSYVKQIKGKKSRGEYTFFTEEALRTLLEQGGFRVVSIEPTFAGQCLIALAEKPRS